MYVGIFMYVFIYSYYIFYALNLAQIKDEIFFPPNFEIVQTISNFLRFTSYVVRQLVRQLLS